MNPNDPPLPSEPAPNRPPSPYQRLLLLYQQVLARIDRRLLRVLYTKRVRRVTLQSLPFWVASVLTGLVAVGYERAFIWAEQTSFAWLRYNPLLAFLITPLGFAVAWLLVKVFAPAARGSGIPQVMAGITLSTPATHGKTAYLLSMQVAIVKVMSSVVLLLSGGVIGREGPTIQLSAAIFRAVNRLQPAGWPQLSRQIALITGVPPGWQPPLTPHWAASCSWSMS